jgi:hypothetical protein
MAIARIIAALTTGTAATGHIMGTDIVRIIVAPTTGMAIVAGKPTN